MILLFVFLSWSHLRDKLLSNNLAQQGHLLPKTTLLQQMSVIDFVLYTWAWQLPNKHCNIQHLQEYPEADMQYNLDIFFWYFLCKLLAKVFWETLFLDFCLFVLLF